MSVLQSTELKGIVLNGPVKLAIEHNSLFAYIFSNDTIHVFDSTSLMTYHLPPPEKAIQGTPTCISLSPNHKFLAAGYTDGGIQLFDIEASKAVKVVSKPKKKPVNTVLFINESILISGDNEGNVNQYKLTNALITITVKESNLASFQTPILGISAPQINRFIESGSKAGNTFRCLSQVFSTLVGVLTDTTMTLVSIGSEFKIIGQLEAMKAHVDYFLVDPETLLLAISSNLLVNIYKMNGLTQPELTNSKSLLDECEFVSFFSDSILAALSGEHNCEIIQFVDHTSVSTVIDHTGYFLNSQNCLLCFCPDRLWSMSLQSFNDKMDLFRENADIDGAIQLGQKALEGDPKAIIGLPQNAAQRALIIEKQLSNQLSVYTSEQLSHPEKADEMADYLIKLSLQLKMQDWLIEGGMQIFNENGLLNNFFKKILIADPEATHFSYTTEFVSLLLDNNEGLDISSFLTHLPNKIAPPTLLLNFAMKTKNNQLLSDIYLHRLNDPIGAATVLGNAGLWPAVVTLIDEYFNYDIIKWLFAATIEDNRVVYPRFAAVIGLDEEVIIALLSRIDENVREKDEPFSETEFVNAFIQTLDYTKRPPSSRLYNFVEGLVLGHDVPLQNGSLRYLLNLIFSSTKIVPDNRVALLNSILAGDVPFQFKESLLPLCDAFGYTQAKQTIQLEAKKFESVLREKMIDPHSNVFDFATKAAAEDPKTIRKGIIANADLLVMKDLNRLLEMLFSTFPDVIDQFIEAISDPMIKNVMTHAVLTDTRSTHQLSVSRSAEYIHFLCEYYPTEVRNIIDTLLEGVQLSDLLTLCSKYQIYDACSTLAYKIGDFEKYTECTRIYLQNELMLYADDPNHEDKLNMNFQFIMINVHNLYQKKLKKGQEQANIATILIKCFVVPIYAIEKTGDEHRLEVVCSCLQQICSVVSNALTFHQLVRLLIIEFAELEIGSIKNALISVVNDYTYDIDTFISLASLIKDDEQRANINYIRKIILGVIVNDLLCPSCHTKIAGCNSSIRIFECGHAFHDKSECIPQNECPVCHPDEKLDEEGTTSKPLTVTDTTVKRVLKRFEQKLASKIEVGQRSSGSEQKERLSFTPIAKLT